MDLVEPAPPGSGELRFRLPVLPVLPSVLSCKLPGNSPANHRHYRTVISTVRIRNIKHFTTMSQGAKKKYIINSKVVTSNIILFIGRCKVDI